MRESVDELYTEAYRCLEEHEPKRALRIGKQLKRLRHSSAFEIMARAYVGLDKPRAAIRVLERGVKKVPDVWVLWDQLGCYYSDAGRFDEAVSALERARTLAGQDHAQATLNLAIALNRTSQHEDALRALDAINASEDSISARAAAERAVALNGVGRFDQAERVAAAAIEAYTRSNDAGGLDSGVGEEHLPGSDVLAGLHANRGEAVWRGRRDRIAALADAWKAIELDRSDELAASLVREIERVVSCKASYFRIVIEGVWHEPLDPGDSPPGFYSTFDVVADTPDEALGFIRLFEPVEVRASLRVAQYKRIEARPDEPKGVYHAPRAYQFFKLEDD